MTVMNRRKMLLGNEGIQRDGGGGSPNDAILFARWYDLPAGEKSDYIDWAHKVHLPLLAALPGVAWAAHFQSAPPHRSSELNKLIQNMKVQPAEAPDLGTGSQYLILAAGSSPGVFLGTQEFDGAHTPEARRFLGLRQGVRTCLFGDFIRVDGPASAERAAVAPPIGRIQFGTYRVHRGSEGRVWNWYITRNNRQFVEHPGAVQMRNLIALAGWARFGVFYEFTSIEANRNWGEVSVSELRRAKDDPTAFQFTDSLLHAPSTALFDRIWPPAVAVPSATA